ncbi:hypothetical protein C8Q80DRAFT_1163830 [Daedaleopsis nitida]|nr:hypothetical protein C8Q80DRAFT_1163830 [Daedaleopsis nitida]
MPTATATATMTAPSVISLKPSPTSIPPAAPSSSSSSSSAAATLRSLYPRAARAFLQRDVALTHSLLTSALSLVQPPTSLVTIKDALSSHRRKWDILRITFETTLYASPPPMQDPESLPPTLRANLMLTPEPLIATLHARSLQLYTPTDPPQKPTSAFLPGQILVTLVLASLKLDCPEVGRNMIEDWLAKHGQESDADDSNGYSKVLELYCLHVLPRLQDWEYAEEFLTYERELPHDVRQVPMSTDPSSSNTSRSTSPALSDSSTSSSSTHTATPHTVRPGASGRLHAGIAPFTPSQSPTPKPREGRVTPPHSDSSSSLVSIASTATSRTVTPQTAERERARAGKTRRGTAHSNGHANVYANGHTDPQERAKSRSRSIARPLPTSVNPVIRRSSFGTPATESGTRPPSTLALLRASLASVLQNTSARVFSSGPGRAITAGNASSTGSAGGRAVDAVRRRLRGTEGQGSVLGSLWGEVARAVLDTVRMAGRGLV